MPPWRAGGLILALCALALAAPRVDANAPVMVRGDFLNQLYQPQGGIYTNAPADRASSIALHGGHISAASPGPGRGTTFTVAVPITPQREGATMST